MPSSISEAPRKPNHCTITGAISRPVSPPAPAGSPSAMLNLRYSSAEEETINSTTPTPAAHQATWLNSSSPARRRSSAQQKMNIITQSR